MRELERVPRWLSAGCLGRIRTHNTAALARGAKGACGCWKGAWRLNGKTHRELPPAVWMALVLRLLALQLLLSPAAAPAAELGAAALPARNFHAVIVSRSPEPAGPAWRRLARPPT